MIHILRLFAFTFLVLLLAFVGKRTVFAGDSDLVLSEVVYNPTCHGTTNDSLCAGSSNTETHFEWVEIYNKGATSVNINGWQLCDNNGCDTLSNVSIGAGEYWAIAYNATALQTEFNQYTPSYTVISGRSVFLSSPLGGSSGLSNTADYVYLLNASSTAVDCVSWASTAGTFCGGLTYIVGGGGMDTSLSAALNGQSITNIQGTWYEHGPSDASQQASPYVSNSAAPGGSPNAVTLSAFSASSASTLPATISVLLLGSGLLILILGGAMALALRRQCQ